MLTVAAMLATGVYATTSVTASGRAEPQRVKWNGEVIRIAISTSLTSQSSNIKTETDVVGAVRRSLLAWQNASGIRFEVEFTDRQSLSAAGIVGDGVNLITIAQTPENVLFFSKTGLSESAKTRVFFNRRGAITEADIVLNPFLQYSSDGTIGTFDLESTLTHEIGHLLGIRHTGVLGAVMSETISKNGSFTYPTAQKRDLAESDITAVRDLYGAPEGVECCSSISGKLTIDNGHPAKGIRVWAEEDGTGRVISVADTQADGSYRIGGLLQGDYFVFWQKLDDPSATQMGDVGLVRLASNESQVLSESLAVSQDPLELRFIGLDAHLSDGAVQVTPGREQVLYIGGKELDPDSLQLEFNSPYFRIARSSVVAEDFGDGLSALSFVLSIDPSTPKGIYSVFAITKDEQRTALIGALIVK